LEQGLLEVIQEILQASISRIAIAAIVMFTGLVAGKILGLLAHNILRHMKLNHTLNKAFDVSYNIEAFISTAVSFIIYAVTFMISLYIIGLNNLFISIAGALVIILLLLSAVFALRDLIPNFIVGVEIQRKGFFKEGDLVVIDGEHARIVEAGLLETILEAENHERIIIPNSGILKKEIRVIKSKKDIENA
jgi:small-conductance mechanosensitive channel